MTRANPYLPNAPLRPIPLVAALVAAEERIAALEADNARLRAELVRERAGLRPVDGTWVRRRELP